MEAATQERLAVPVSDHDHSDGPTDAATTLVVYGDYECPYTRQVNQAIRRIQAVGGEPFRFVFRHFPLREIHLHAQHAAEVAEIAHDAGQFWAMHELLFRNQRALEDDDLVQYAAQLGLAEAGVRQALRTRATAGRIAEDVRSGQASNVRGTPALFINGLRYRGKRDTNTLDAALRLPSTATVIPIQTTGEPTDEPTKRVNRRRPLGDGASDE
jgi:protein-disulfide isomerase